MIALTGCCPGTYGISYTCTHQLVLRYYTETHKHQSLWKEIILYNVLVANGKIPERYHHNHTSWVITQTHSPQQQLHSRPEIIAQQSLLKLNILTCFHVIIFNNPIEPEHPLKAHSVAVHTTAELDQTRYETNSPQDTVLSLNSKQAHSRLEQHKEMQQQQQSMEREHRHRFK